MKAELEQLRKFKADALRVMQNGDGIKEINRLREENTFLREKLQQMADQVSKLVKLSEDQSTAAISHLHEIDRQKKELAEARIKESYLEHGDGRSL